MRGSAVIASTSYPCPAAALGSVADASGKGLPAALICSEWNLAPTFVNQTHSCPQGPSACPRPKPCSEKNS
jgi:hypothetical protein